MSEPNPFTDYGQDIDLKDRYQSCINLTADPQTILMRCQFADEISKCSENQISVCERLVRDQHMQHQGWLAVVANLEDSIGAFRESWLNLDTTFKQFVEQKSLHQDLLINFHHDLELLSRIPILPELCANVTTSVHGNSGDSGDGKTVTASLFDWINQKNRQNNLYELSEICLQALERFGPDSLDGLMTEAKMVISSSDRVEMKEIKGLADRLYMLDQRMEELKRIKSDQKDLSDSISNNFKTFKRTNDPSIIPELCNTHEAQLDIMMRNYHKIRDIRRKCVASKQELSSAIHFRLKWVMTVEKQQAEVSERLLVYRENIRRLKSHLETVQQIHCAPELYVKAVAEVIRRKNFSQAYIDFCHLISNDSRSIYFEESRIRREFVNLLSNHFLSTLFAGVTDSLPAFALDPPSIFDDSLPPLADEHLQLMRQSVPQLVEKLNLHLDLESTNPGQVLASYLRKVSSNQPSTDDTENDDENDDDDSAASVPFKISSHLYKYHSLLLLDSTVVCETLTPTIQRVQEMKCLLNDMRDEVTQHLAKSHEMVSQLTNTSSDALEQLVTKVCAPLVSAKQQLNDEVDMIAAQLEKERVAHRNQVTELQEKVNELTASTNELKSQVTLKQSELEEAKHKYESESIALKKKESDMNLLMANLKLESEQVRSNVQVENALLKEEVDKLKMQLQVNIKKREKELREAFELDKFNALKVQRERLMSEHRHEMDTLRSRFRLASSIERAQDPLNPPESPALENAKKEIAELRQLLECKESEIVQLTSAHETEIQALKQVQYNEAVNRIRSEKDQVISVYRDKIDQLTKQLKEIDEANKKSSEDSQEKTGARISNLARLPSSGHFNDKVAILR